MLRMDLLRHLLLAALRGGGGNKNISVQQLLVDMILGISQLEEIGTWHLVCERNIIGKIMQLD